MTVIAVILLILSILFLIFTRTTYCYIKYDGKFTLEFHFVIFSLTLTIPTKKSNERRPKLSFYPRLVNSLIKLLSVSEIEIKKLHLPTAGSEEIGRIFTLKYGVFSLFSSLFAYLEENTKRITVNEDSLILYPDDKSFHLDLRLYTELYNIVFCLFRIFPKMKFKKRKKVYVGN